MGFLHSLDGEHGKAMRWNTANPCEYRRKMRKLLHPLQKHSHPLKTIDLLANLFKPLQTILFLAKLFQPMQLHGKAMRWNTAKPVRNQAETA